tara:strand:- start:1065 stop:2360 length:1296 start_codon:yes stop_codon:yes gene_type:complete
MNSNLSLGLVWLATVLGAFLVGNGLRDTEPNAENSSSPNAKAGLDEPDRVVRSARFRGSGRKVENEGAAPTEFASSVASLDSGFEVDPVVEESSYSGRSLNETLRAASDPRERMILFLQALDGMNASNVEDVLAAFKEHTEPNRRYSELRMLLNAWAEFDPQGALAWADKLGGWEERSAVGAVLERWAADDLESTLAWAREKYKGNDNPYVVGIIGGLSRTDPARASELMLEMPYGRNRGRAASTLLDVYWDKGETQATEWVTTMESGSVKEFLTSQVAERIAREDVSRSAQWVESLEVGRAKNRAVGMVAYQWARKEDPALAAQWVDGIDEEESKFAGMEGLVKVWVDRDATATAEWLNEYEPSAGKDGAVEIFVNAIKRKDPATAMQWAETITEADDREDAIGEVSRSWRRGDPDGYQQWKEARAPEQQ